METDQSDGVWEFSFQNGEFGHHTFECTGWINWSLRLVFSFSFSRFAHCLFFDHWSFSQFVFFKSFAFVLAFKSFCIRTLLAMHTWLLEFRFVCFLRLSAFASLYSFFRAFLFSLLDANSAEMATLTTEFSVFLFSLFHPLPSYPHPSSHP